MKFLPSMVRKKYLMSKMNNHRQFQKSSDNSCFILSLFLSVVIALVCFVGYKGYTFVTGCFTPYQPTEQEAAAVEKYCSHVLVTYSARTKVKNRELDVYVPKKYGTENYDILASYILDEAREAGCRHITRVEIIDPATDEMTGYAIYTGRK